MTSSDSVAPKMDDASSESERNMVEGEVEIGDYAYVGAYALVNPCVKIGRGAVVGAYSYVDKDIGDYEVGWGQPWRRRKTRRVD
ncbi:MAG: hypothetical protein HY459_05070 [Parcubacteria group bacterium]|nr:hypothetical protein [Parcubacteria group bacterium]